MDTYALVHYRSKVHPLREPGHIATVAAFAGVEGPNPLSASVLEIGCGTGEALIPVAARYPAAAFLGIDPSSAQIELGREAIAQLALSNIALETKTAAEVRGSGAAYDYIICHGVFSWVSSTVQKEILELIAEGLKPDGLAYLSYNTLPGWNFRRTIRDLLSLYVPKCGDPDEQIEAARKLLKTFEAAVGYEFERPYSMLMNAELQRIASESDAYLFHELLAEENNPVLLTQMSEALSQVGLRHLADSRMSRNGLHRLAKNCAQRSTIRDIEAQFNGSVQLEQFLDFAFHTPFRESVICRAERRTQVLSGLEVLKQCWLSASFEAIEGAPDLRTDFEEEFVDLAGTRLFESSPAAKAALMILREAWPKSMPFEALVKKVAPSAGTFSCTPDQLAAFLFDLGKRDFLDITLYPAAVGDIGPMPCAQGFARMQAREGRIVTNLRYESVEVGDFERELLQYLDGQHTKDALVDRLIESLAEHGARLEEGGEEISDPVRQRALVVTLVSDGMETLRRAALLLP